MTDEDAVRAERTTDLIESVLDVLDPLLGPDLSVSTVDGPEGVEFTIAAVVEVPNPTYQPDPALPAGDGWCEAVIRPRPIDNEPGGRYCYTRATFEREGRRVCGLHRNAGPGVVFGRQT